MKQFIKSILRILATPLRLINRRRNGVDPGKPRKEIPNDILLGMVRDEIRNGHTATILVKGYSMRPFLEHCRDRVVLAPATELSIGDAVLGEIAPGQFVLHRIIAIDGDDITLMGDGNIRGTELCLRQNVAGVVTHYVRPQRTIPATDASLVRQIRIWRRLLPVRRWLLAMYRACL